MDIVGFITSQTLFDILFLLLLLGALVLGFVQGAIRRLLGIVSLVLAFLIAVNLRDPLGAFLAKNWTQFPTEYSYMLAFLGLFVLGAVLLTILIQGFYHRSLIRNSQALDEIVGAVLGVLQAILLVGLLGIILDSYFKVPGAPHTSGELGFLRSLYEAWDGSEVALVYRDVLIPAFLSLVGWLVPDAIEALYRR